MTVKCNMCGKECEQQDTRCPDCGEELPLKSQHDSLTPTNSSEQAGVAADVPNHAPSGASTSGEPSWTLPSQPPPSWLPVDQPTVTDENTAATSFAEEVFSDPIDFDSPDEPVATVTPAPSPPVIGKVEVPVVTEQQPETAGSGSLEGGQSRAFRHVCSYCYQILSHGQEVCPRPKCGKRLYTKCLGCGTIGPPKANYCARCGDELARQRRVRAPDLAATVAEVASRRAQPQTDATEQIPDGWGDLENTSIRHLTWEEGPANRTASPPPAIHEQPEEDPDDKLRLAENNDWNDEPVLSTMASDVSHPGSVVASSDSLYADADDLDRELSVSEPTNRSPRATYGIQFLNPDGTDLDEPKPLMDRVTVLGRPSDDSPPSIDLSPYAEEPKTELSGNHAKIIHREDGFYLEDADSATGTSFGGTRGHDIRLEPGDVRKLNDEDLIVFGEDAVTARFVKLDSDNNPRS